jgi:type I restriction enzyme, S subunit
MTNKQGRSEISPLSLEISAELPEGWTWTTLGDVCSKITDGTHKTPNYIADGVPFISTANLVPFKIGFDFSQYKRLISQREHDELTRRCHPEKGDVLVSKCGTIGRAKEIDVDFPFSIFVGLALLKPYPGLFAPGFLEVWLNTPQLQRRFDDLAPGSTRRTLTLSGLKKAEIPVPPCAEQIRIVAQVRELLTRVNATRDRLAKVPAILKRFRQAVRAAACSGRLTEDWRTDKSEFESGELRVERTRRARVAEYEKLCSVAVASGLRKPRRPSNLEPKIRSAELGQSIPQGWFWASVEDIASIRQHALSSGPFGSALGTKDYRASGIPVIRGQNIQDGEFLSTNLTYVSIDKAASLSRSAAYPGDIVVVAVGSSGQAAVIPDNLPRSILSQNCNKITVDESLVIPEFALLSLRNDIARDQLAERTTDTARPFLSLTNLKRTVIAIPSLDEQREIVRRGKALFKLAAAVGSRLDAVWKYTEKLTQAILGGAFRGGLVPTEAELARHEGRSYEPASELLARVKALSSPVKSSLRQNGRMGDSLAD